MSDRSNLKTGCPLVLIEWEDSAQPILGWMYLEDFSGGPAIQCVSVGWLIYDSADTKALAPNMGCLNSDDSVQASGIIRIPTRCITRTVKLKEKRYDAEAIRPF